jgi:PTS system nitrogen regulatory IIA component
MDLTQIVSERLVITALREQTKAGVLRELVDVLVREHPTVDATRLLEVLWERERLGSTGIVEGVAIPHGKLPGLPKVVGVVGCHREGIDFESLDGARTKLFFLLVSPDDAVGQHLKALAQVSRLVKDAAFCAGLLGATDDHDLYLRLVRADEMARTPSEQRSPGRPAASVS